MLTGKTGKYQNLTRYIPIHKIHDILTSEEKAILLPIYCLTGCDTVSSFHGHGKSTAFKILRENAAELQPLAELGTNYRGK